MRMLRTRTTSIVSNWPQSCNYNIIVAFIMLVSLENLLKTTDIFQVLRLSVCLSVYFPAYLLWKACSTRKFSIFFQAALLNILQKKIRENFSINCLLANRIYSLNTKEPRSISLYISLFVINFQTDETKYLSNLCKECENILPPRIFEVTCILKSFVLDKCKHLSNADSW